MFLENFPIQISGTLKVSPEIAKQMFNFNMHPDASGITFSRLKDGRIYMKNYFPDVYIAKSEKRKASSRIFAIIGKIAHTHLSDIIHPIWDIFAKQYSYSNGYCAFIATNMPLAQKAWDKMLISKGRLEPPKFHTSVSNNSVTLHFKRSSDYCIGIAMLDTKDFSLLHIPPRPTRSFCVKPTTANIHNLIIFAYAQQDELFSDSVAYICNFNHG